MDLEVGVTDSKGSSDLKESVADDKAIEVISPKECCDPYFYTKREEFTSEIFKIEIQHLPNYFGYGQIKKLLTSKLKLKPHKIKVIGNQSPALAFVTFKCETDREEALTTICGYQWKGKLLHAKKASPMADPLVQKRKADLVEDCTVSSKKVKTDQDSDLPISVRLQNVVTPLWTIKYEDQLKQKQDEMTKFLIKLGHAIKNINPNMKKLLKSKSEDANSALCCPLLPIVASPVQSAYRNKCEFNVGQHPDSGEATVGFRISSYKEGSKCVAEASHCTNIPNNMIKAAEAFQKYIRSSTKGIFNPENHEGYWRQLTVRTSLNGSLLLIVVMHPQNLTKEELQEEKLKLKDYFQHSEIKVTSLYFQPFAKKEKVEPDVEHIFGSEFIEEELLGMKFCISPESFFQVNTLGAERLYTTVAEFAGFHKDTTVLDFCCGTGTIGLSVAKNVLKVIGVELCASAVLDARRNAESNGITNAEFICGKVEDVIFDVLNNVTGEDVVAILDPPRAGISNKVIKAIRGMDKLKRLVYLSCSPQNAMTNFIDLCRPTSNNYRGPAFLPVKAVAVDLFPLTVHCELILLFER